MKKNKTFSVWKILVKLVTELILNIFYQSTDICNISCSGSWDKFVIIENEVQRQLIVSKKNEAFFRKIDEICIF